MSIQILIDMNLSPDWVDELSKHGWASVHWSAIPREERDSIVEPFIDELPSSTQADIVTLVLLAPSELEQPNETFREYMLNTEFENPSPSML